MANVKKCLKLLSVALGLFFALIASIMVWTKARSLESGESDRPLAIRWEGFYHDMNHRDLGSSINDCLGTRVFKDNVVHRSAGWFSGWSCSKVGNPDVIFSLNYSPAKRERFFCHKDRTKIVGRFFNDRIQLSDLEFIENWNSKKMRVPACLFIENILESVISGKKVLIHCDAGRDRSGTLSALLIAMASEKLGLLDERMIEAIECDYRKTESLAESKYGRMSNFLRELQKRGGVGDFLSDRCGISVNVVSKAAEILLFSAENGRRSLSPIQQANR